MMGDKRLSLSGAVLIAAVLAGLLLLWVDGTRAQAPTVQPRTTALTASIVTGTDRLIWDATGINPGDELYPDVAYNSQDDEYLVVFEWEDAGGGGGRDLASIRVDRSGQAALSPNGVATSNSFTDTRPAVAYNSSNNTYLVVWERRFGSGGARDIFGAILNSNGSVNGTAFSIANRVGDQQYPDVAYSAPVTQYLVVWEDHYTPLVNPPDIFGASVDSSGSVVSSLSVTGLDEPGGQARPAVTTNGTNGRWMVVWRDSRNSGSTGYDIYGQLMQYSGGLSLWGGQVRMADYWSNSDWPDVAWGQVGPGQGEFLTVWSDSGVILGQRMGASGALFGDEIAVSTDQVSGKNHPAAVFDSVDETWWVVWQDSRDYG